MYNPLLYMINGVRYGILGVSDVAIGLSPCFISCICAHFSFGRKSDRTRSLSEVVNVRKSIR